MSGTDGKKEINILDFLTSKGTGSGATGGVDLNAEALLKWIQDTHEKLNKYEELLEKYKNDLGILSNNYDRQTSDIKTLKDDVNEQRNRIPEVVGIFSAIIALVLIDVSVIKSAESFLAAILLIIGLTCTVSIFALLIHKLFAKSEGSVVNFGKYFWIPIGIQIILLIIGISFYYMGKDLYSIPNVASNVSANATTSTLSTPINTTNKQ